MDQETKLQKLNDLIRHCRNSSFYKDRLPDMPLSSLEDLKKLPLITKEELKKHSPFGFICVPEEELFQYHETFGTTGTPVSVWLTREDFLDLADSVNQGGIDFKENDIVLIRFPYAISGVAHFVHAAAQLRNACVIPASSRTTVSPYTRIVNLLSKLRVTILAALPLQGVLIAETAEFMGLKPKKDFPHLRAIYTAGEVLTPLKRNLLEEIWGVPVSDNYGLTEIGAAVVDCKYGTPHPLEEKFIFEFLDDRLENEVKTGETGNLVVTTLNRKGTPLIRYYTGDRAKKVLKECPCGRHITVEIHGRAQDLILAGSKAFDQWELSEIVAALPCRRFWAAGPDSGGIRIVAEEEKPGQKVNCELVRILEEKYGIDLYIEILKKGTLFDRSILLQVNSVGKPKYIYSGQEMADKAYMTSARD